MRKNRAGKEKGFKMFILDDDRNILDALSANFLHKRLRSRDTGKSADSIGTAEERPAMIF